MPTTLEITLVSRASRISSVKTHFTDDRRGVDCRFFFGSASEYDPAKEEWLPVIGTPQRALLILLLRAYGTAFHSSWISTPASSRLARSLLDTLRKQASGDTRKWLYALLGLGRTDNIRDWFILSGSASANRRCSVGIGPGWRSTTLKITLDGTLVEIASYKTLADRIENEAHGDDPHLPLSIVSFNLLVWNPLLACFAPSNGPVKYGDKVQLQIKVSQMGYLYVFWVDQKAEAVTVYPFSGPHWQWPVTESPEMSWTIPQPGEGVDRHALQVAGPRGIETILVLASTSPLSGGERARLRRIFAGLKPNSSLPPPEHMVTSQFGRITLGRPLRTVRWMEVPQDIKNYQAQLAALFRPHFDHVLACTISNAGKVS